MMIFPPLIPGYIYAQVQYSLLDRRPLHSGLVDVCEKHNVQILAYGVLAGGFLTDRWLGAKRPVNEVYRIEEY